MRCTKCCEDLDIRFEDLIFPGRMPVAGQEFCMVHGLSAERLFNLRHGAVDIGNGMVKIRHRCEQLTIDGLCRIYEDRPTICREFHCDHDCEELA